MFKIEPTERPSLKILNALYQYDDFMESVRTLVDLGCGEGHDLKWWATASTRDDKPQPLNIQCVGVDLMDQLPMVRTYQNMSYQRVDFETTVTPPKNLFDVLWCHDSFQYCISPIQTLIKWRDISSEGAMLVIAVPQTMQIQRNQLAHYVNSGMFYHYSLVNLIYMLAVTGWDCRAGFFQQEAADPWIRAVVYKSKNQPMDPKKTSWYDLLSTELLPPSAEASVKAHGHVKQQDLVLPWLDKSYTWLGKQ
jgi:trans-aconitate methyltransferase